MIEPDTQDLLMKSLPRLLDKVRRGKCRVAVEKKISYGGECVVGTIKGIPVTLETLDYVIKLPEKKIIRIHPYEYEPMQPIEGRYKLWGDKILPRELHYSLTFATGKIQIDSANISPIQGELYKIAEELYKACDADRRRKEDLGHEKAKERSRKLELAQKKKLEKFLKSI
jgi:hypothetical protein